MTAESKLVVMDEETGTQTDFVNPITAAKDMRRIVDVVAGGSHRPVVTSFEPPFEQIYRSDGSLLECVRLLELDRKLFIGSCQRYHK